jgi:hypothetical protein
MNPEITEFLDVFEELSNKSDTTRRIRLNAGESGPVAVNPIDAGKFLVVSVQFDPWSAPGGTDRDAVSWRDEWLFVGSRNQWFRVVTVENRSSSEQSLLVKIRAL